MRLNFLLVLMLQMGGRSEPIAYWIVVGDEVATTDGGRKLAQMKFGLRVVIADSFWVRDAKLAARLLGKCSRVESAAVSA